MNKKYIALLILIALFSIAAVSAQDNQTVTQASDELNSNPDTLSSSMEDEKLESTLYFDEHGNYYDDDSVVTHDVVKYYGDKDKKFNVKVYDDDKKPERDVEVSFGKLFNKYTKKYTNGKGIVSFSVNYKVGIHDVETLIESDDGDSYWQAYNVVKVKSTIPTKELVKFSTSKKKFKIKFLDSKGKKLKNKVVKIKIKGKIHKVKTNGKGIAKIKSKFKIGKHKITAINPVTGEKRKISVVVLKKGTHKVNIRIDDPTVYFPTKKLKNGDYLDTVYETKHRQYSPGVYVELSSGGLEKAKHTKLKKAKFYFKNKKTGKIITKVSKKVKYDTIKVKPKKGYSPYKATVWYKDKK